MSIEEHVLSIESLPGYTARGHCSCGDWTSHVQEVLGPDDYKPLEEAFDVHCDAVFEMASEAAAAEWLS